MTTANTYAKLVFVANYLKEKSTGNGFYDFQVTTKNYQVHFAWKAISEKVLDESFRISDARNFLEFRQLLADYCELVSEYSLRAWVSKWYPAEAVLDFDGADWFLDPDIEPTRIAEMEAINYRHQLWFNTVKPLYYLFLQSNKVLLPSSKRRSNRFMIDDKVLQAVRDNLREHRGTARPAILLCVNATDAKKYPDRREKLTFREAIRGINRLPNKIELSDEAARQLYDGTGQN